MSRTSRETGIATGIAIGIGTEIVTVAVIEIVIATEIEIATEIGIASTKALAFIIPRIMAATSTAQTLTSRATGTGCSRAQTMATADRAMTLSVPTSTRAGLRADSFHYSPTGLTNKLIEMALCVAIRRGIRTGSCILRAGAFAVSCLHTRQIPKVFPAATLQGDFFCLSQEVFR